MAVPGETCCGSRIQRCMFCGVLARWPATMTRVAMPSSGGPTVPVAVRTFFSYLVKPITDSMSRAFTER